MMAYTLDTKLKNNRIYFLRLGIIKKIIENFGPKVVGKHDSTQILKK